MNICAKCNQPYPIGAWPICQDSSGKNGHSYSRGGILIGSIHSSERAVVYMNPKTGEHRTPARADQPMPESYRRLGYERVELDTHQKRKDFEKQTGLIQEVAHFNTGGAGAERSLTEGVDEMPGAAPLDRAYGDKTLLTAENIPLHLRD